MSTGSASARRGTRSRSIAASATSCILCPTFLLRAAEEGTGRARSWADENPRCASAAGAARMARAADFIEDVRNRDEVCGASWPRPERIGVGAGGRSAAPSTAGSKVSPDGTMRTSDRYLMVGRDGGGTTRSGAGGLALCADGALGAGAVVGGVSGRTRVAVFRRRSLRRQSIGSEAAIAGGEPADRVGAFAGPAFDPHDIGRASRLGSEDPPQIDGAPELSCAAQ